MITMDDLDLNGKTIFIRMDLNVPIYNNKITSYERIDRSIPTIELALQKNAKIIIASHLGRPKKNKDNKHLSLFPVFKYLKKKFYKEKVTFTDNYLQGIKIKNKEIIVLENVRFNTGETENNAYLSKKYANLCDIFVMDAFATAHRLESSTYGICEFVKQACIGPLLLSEIKILKKILLNPKKPMLAIIGGAKVSTKFNLLHSLMKVTDFMIVGGGIANTFLSIKNNIGKSLHEPNFKKQAANLYHSKKIFIPIDVCLKKDNQNQELRIIKPINKILDDEEIMDIGDQSINKYVKLIQKAKTILWNGPLGVFEIPKFRKGTEIIAQNIAESKAFSIAGGGDTISVINLLKLQNKISYISTGGGAFLKFIEHKTLPCIEKIKEFTI